MIALDTNVLVRFLVEDDEAQSAAAAALIEETLSREEGLFVSDVVMCETVRVLGTAYRVRKPEIVAILRDLLRAKQLVFTAPDSLSRALAAYTSGRGDFSDYLIREHARSAGCETVATFDRALLSDRDFTEPQAARRRR
ncbi:MAG TPA: type II toxin-antitoxin system VapC family toxin [Gemmatimonadaceae bacterium]|nr:type II toxin-antitoxin system VapC family toxin [Gemmatimonadaceae bacterium]